MKSATRMPSGGSIPGETALNERARSATANRDDCIDCRRHQVGKAENHQGHPYYREVMQPVAHVLVPSRYSQIAMATRLKQLNAFMVNLAKRGRVDRVASGPGGLMARLGRYRRAAAPTTVQIDPFQAMVNAGSLPSSHHDDLSLVFN